MYIDREREREKESVNVIYFIHRTSINLHTWMFSFFVILPEVLAALHPSM